MIKRLINRVFDRITRKKLLGLGFRQESGTVYTKGTYEVPNTKGMRHAKWIYNFNTKQMLYLTNTVFNNLNSMEMLRALLEWDKSYQKTKNK